MAVCETIRGFHLQAEISASAVDADWCDRAALLCKPISLNGKLEHWKSNLEALNAKALMAASKVQSRMVNFLRGRCPDDLQIHWVWNSFVCNSLREIATMAVLAGLVSDNLEYLGLQDSLLTSNNSMFPVVDEDLGPLVGCYLAVDGCRNTVIRAGMTESGLASRWKQHQRCSKLKDDTTRNRNFYQYYPDKSIPDEVVPLKRASFQELEQRLALGFSKSDRAAVVDLFQWTDIDEAHLSNLKYGDNQGGHLGDKKFKHICYMFELFFAICIDPARNTTENPTCEWQLRLYSQKK